MHAEISIKVTTDKRANRFKNYSSLLTCVKVSAIALKTTSAKKQSEGTSTLLQM